MSANKAGHGWQEDAVGTNAGATATHAAVSGRAHYVAAIQCSGDAAALVTVESPAATILYRKRFAGAFTMTEVFTPGTLQGAGNAAVLVKISASTAACEANIQGYSIGAAGS